MNDNKPIGENQINIARAAGDSDRDQKVLLTGATGFIGGRLLLKLDEEGYRVRCLVRKGEQLRPKRSLEREPEVVYADLLEPETLAEAMEGMDSAYYLVHSMGGRTISETKAFAERDRRAATNFVKAADDAGLKRIIYMGGLGDVSDELSEHLASRQEVAKILSSGSPETTVLRAAVIIGAGGASFEIIRYLVERLPVMTVPRWVNTRAQPIAIEDVIPYLEGCLGVPETAGRSFDVCGPDICTYGELMRIYARVRGLKRLIVSVPMLTPTLSAHWVNLVTPVPAGVVYPLIEGLKNEVICRENDIHELIPIKLTSMKDAICNALVEEEVGPGSLPSQQACLMD